MHGNYFKIILFKRNVPIFKANSISFSIVNRHMVFLSIDEAEKIRKNGKRPHFGMSRIKCVIKDCESFLGPILLMRQ